MALSFTVSIDDITFAELSALVMELHQESSFSKSTFNPAKLNRLVNAAKCNRGKYGLILARQNGTPVGLAYCSAGTYYLGDGHIITTILAISTLKKARDTLLAGRIATGLMAGVVSWSKIRNASEINFSASSQNSMRQAHRYATRAGFVAIGANYSKQLKLVSK